MVKVLVPSACVVGGEVTRSGLRSEGRVCSCGASAGPASAAGGLSWQRVHTGAVPIRRGTRYDGREEMGQALGFGNALFLAVPLQTFSGLCLNWVRRSSSS